MNAVLAYLYQVVDRAGAYVKDLYRREPARVNSAVAGFVVSAAAVVGLTLELPVALVVAGIVLPLLLGTEATRKRVKPVKRPKRRA